MDPAVNRNRFKTRKKLKKQLRRERGKLWLQHGKDQLTSSKTDPLSRASTASLSITNSTSSFLDTDSDSLTDSDSSSGDFMSLGHTISDRKVQQNKVNNSNNTGTEEAQITTKSLQDSSANNKDPTTMSSELSPANEGRNSIDPLVPIPSKANLTNYMNNPPTLATLEDDKSDRVEHDLENYYKDSSDLDFSKHYAIRIFNVDDTFTTLSCTPGTTIKDMILILKKKFSITIKSNYQKSLKSVNCQTYLDLIQNQLLLQKNYYY